MPANATSVAELGIGDYDGQTKVILYATEKQSMRWNAVEGLWLSEPRPTFKFKDNWLTTVSSPANWGYMTNPDGNPGSIGRSGFGWTPQAIHRADAAYAAGLKMQEKIDYLLWVWTGADDLHLATVYFNLNPTDVMSTLISTTAGANIGVELVGDPGVRRFRTTGWVDSLIPTPTKALLAPHLYCKNFGAPLSGPVKLEFFTANWRWKGDPTP